MPPTKVLIVQPLLAPYRLATFRALSTDPRLDVTYAYSDSPPGSSLVNVKDPEGLKTLPLKAIYFGVKGGFYKASYQFGLLKALKKVKPDVVVMGLNPRDISNSLMAKAAKATGAAIVWWGHGVRHQGQHEDVYAKTAQAGDAVLLYYPDAAKKLEALGVDPAKLFVAWNSIDTKTIKSLAQPYTPERDTIVYLGRLVPDKRAPLLAQAFVKAVKEHDLTARLAILGDGADAPETKKIIEEAGLSHLADFPGAVYEESQIAPWFNRAYLCVNPGYVGLLAVHSLAYGVPVAAPDMPGHSPEIMVLRENETGYYFPPENPEALAELLVKTQQDFPTRQRLSQAGMEEILKTFSAENMAKNMADAILHAAKSSRQKN